MQEKTKKANSIYFSNYELFIKLTSLAIICCLTFSCGQKETKQVLSRHDQTIRSESAININNATWQELEKLPGIGEKKARQIVEHREKYGLFRKPEHLLLVPGISDRRFREMRNLLTVE